MKFDRQTISQLEVTLTFSKDPADATIEVQINDIWWPATWQAAAVTTVVRRRPRWIRVALTDDLFAGPDAVDPAQASAIFPGGNEPTLTRVSWPDGTVIVHPCSTVEVPAA